MSKIAKDKGGGQGVPDELDAALASGSVKNLGQFACRSRVDQPG